MRYQVLLKALEQLSSALKTSFDSGTVSKFMDVYAYNNPNEQWDQRLFDKKLISNDLNRLYRMGFLTRRRVKREVQTRVGKSCNRGYKYLYNISKQGKSYTAYLETPKPFRLLVEGERRRASFYLEDFANPLLLKLKSYLRNDQEYRQRVIDGIIKPMQLTPMLNARGRYNRFPQKIDLELLSKCLISQENNETIKSQIESALAKVEQMEIIHNKDNQLFLILIEIMEDPLKLLKLARAQLAKHGINPIIMSDDILANVSKGISHDGRTLLLDALDWIIRETEEQRLA